MQPRLALLPTNQQKGTAKRDESIEESRLRVK
jgi:hypothetical protein